MRILEYRGNIYNLDHLVYTETYYITIKAFKDLDWETNYKEGHEFNGYVSPDQKEHSRPQVRLVFVDGKTIQPELTPIQFKALIRHLRTFDDVSVESFKELLTKTHVKIKWN